MAEHRLTDLARMHIHPERLSKVSDTRVLDIFSTNQPRRLETKRLQDFVGRKLFLLKPSKNFLFLF